MLYCISAPPNTPPTYATHVTNIGVGIARRDCRWTESCRPACCPGKVGSWPKGPPFNIFGLSLRCATAARSKQISSATAVKYDESIKRRASHERRATGSHQNRVNHPTCRSKQACPITNSGPTKKKRNSLCTRPRKRRLLSGRKSMLTTINRSSARSPDGWTPSFCIAPRFIARRRLVPRGSPRLLRIRWLTRKSRLIKGNLLMSACGPACVETQKRPAEIVFPLGKTSTRAM